jgi:enoyl-CoA hydratase
MNQGFSEHEVLIERRGGLGLITLNRPKALNALSLEMIRQISAALRRWENDPGIRTVLFRGTGPRAFSAGGDLKIFHRAGMDFRRGLVHPRVPAMFFAEEYSLNRQIFHYGKPTAAFMNGITMGGGFGIGGNCKYRIATDKTWFAMPETGIGFFPDVGSVYHLLRSPGHMGRYLGLMAAQVGPGDMLAANLAGYYMSSSAEQKLVDGLQAQDPETVIGALSEPYPEGEVFLKHAAKIEATFGHNDVRQIFAALTKDGSEWAAAALEVLRKRSPASVLVTAAHFEQSEGRDFDDIIHMDFILAQRFLERMDLYEGIRAVLIDRDNEPRWNPPVLEDMTRDDVRRYFEPTGYHLNDVKIFASAAASRG